jgi:hypothetical protein
MQTTAKPQRSELEQVLDRLDEIELELTLSVERGETPSDHLRAERAYLEGMVLMARRMGLS